MDYKVKGADLSSVADAIRTKGGTSASLSFPDGFVEAIGNISGGGGGLKHESGTFTCPDSGTTYTLNFENTYSKYVIIIEATETTKAAIIAYGGTSAKTFGIVGNYPKITVNNVPVDTNTTLLKVAPSTGVTSTGNVSSFTYSATSIECPISVMQYANYLYQGYSYNYVIVELP